MHPWMPGYFVWSPSPGHGGRARRVRSDTEGAARALSRAEHAPVQLTDRPSHEERTASDSRDATCYGHGVKLVAGIDSSTQSTKVLLVRAEDGAVVGEASAPHPDGTECHPDRW